MFVGSQKNDSCQHKHPKVANKEEKVLENTIFLNSKAAVFAKRQ
jgi:hypothetical protein